jgi:hypothetical protein
MATTALHILGDDLDGIEFSRHYSAHRLKLSFGTKEINKTSLHLTWKAQQCSTTPKYFPFMNTTSTAVVAYLCTAKNS